MAQGYLRDGRRPAAGHLASPAPRPSGSRSVEPGGAEAPSEPSGPRTLAGRLDRGAVALRPQLFAYQYLFELAPELPD
ncbi:MAG: hypothetical protein H0U29_05960 [Acidimicrobiia bacterium]|nr:hypothetical protein [Acidimicrobiia bacterium]